MINNKNCKPGHHQIKPEGCVKAILGPTNTGKTHYAMERMLAHPSGMIGFPLRLLARENYQRAVQQKGVKSVALITGEEKIIPPQARYFMCTVEAMPVSRRVDFLAIDEIQMCADSDRGHVFTDRLLYARGGQETLFMGADTMHALLKKLVPGIQIETRPRLSELKYAGALKLRNLPKRSAIVAFSAADVYAIAETMRRQSGGVAVVLGALSPKTRNAQVEMYQQGDVDYLVATDAIGMGLNMDVDHIAFSALGKFDGRRHRALRSAELGQIAGRAGRHMNNGSFGTTGACPTLDAEHIGRIENHEFKSLNGLSWRQAELDFTSPRSLKHSLGTPPDMPGLICARGMTDERVLDCLISHEKVLSRAIDYDSVSLLWDVCRIPDFRKILSDAHAHLLVRIYDFLSIGNGLVDDDWLAKQINDVDRTDGDIDVLSGRISGIRIWSYIAFQSGWLRDPLSWQQRCRVVEDRLSDALHERLTKRFVDQKTALLSRRLKDDGELQATVTPEHLVMVENQPVGRIEGFRYISTLSPGLSTQPNATKSITNAAEMALHSEINKRMKRFENVQGDDLIFATDAFGLVPLILWDGCPVAKLVKGRHVLKPEINVIFGELLTANFKLRVKKRIQRWLLERLNVALEPLINLESHKTTSSAVRAIQFQVVENLGAVGRHKVATYIETLSRIDRIELRQQGIVIGRENIYVPTLLKPKTTVVQALLWGLWSGMRSSVPAPGRASIKIDDHHPAVILQKLGYLPLGQFAVRIDLVEKIIAEIWQSSIKRNFIITPKLLSMAGCGHEIMAEILKNLGFKVKSGSGIEARYSRHRKVDKLGKKPKPKIGRASRTSVAKLQDHFSTPKKYGNR